MKEITNSKIEKMIYIVRGQKVILDSDLAELYQVETKHLNRQVRRNLLRFPNDFMFQLSPEEYQTLKYQFGTSKTGSGGKQKLPLVFTENGIAMLSSVLNSDHAILMNIAIMRIFTKLRSFLLLEQELRNEIDNFKRGTNSIFKIVFERMDNLEELVTPKLPLTRKKIGLRTDQK